MIAPSASFIEQAAEQLNRNPIPELIRSTQTKELESFGDERAKTLGATGISVDFQKGYELGLQTARCILAGSIMLEMKEVDPSVLL